MKIYSTEKLQLGDRILTGLRRQWPDRSHWFEGGFTTCSNQFEIYFEPPDGNDWKKSEEIDILIFIAGFEACWKSIENTIMSYLFGGRR